LGEGEKVELEEDIAPEFREQVDRELVEYTRWISLLQVHRQSTANFQATAKRKALAALKKRFQKSPLARPSKARALSPSLADFEVLDEVGGSEDEQNQSLDRPGPSGVPPTSTPVLRLHRVEVEVETPPVRNPVRHQPQDSSDKRKKKHKHSSSAVVSTPAPQPLPDSSAVRSALQLHRLHRLCLPLSGNRAPSALRDIPGGTGSLGLRV